MNITKKHTKRTKKALEISELNVETKDYSLNASLTNKFSLNSLDNLLLGNTSTKSLYKKDVEVLLDRLSLEIPVQEYIGPNAINETLWNRYVKGTITTPLILKFLQSKKHVRPYAFLKLMETAIELNTHLIKKYKTEARITREHLLDLGIYEEIILNSSQPVYLRSVMYEFFTKFVDPFLATKDADVWVKEERVVVKFHHPEYERYMKYLRKDRIVENTESHYHHKFKRFFLWLTSVLEDFKEYNINNIPIYKIRNHHLADYKRYLLIQVRNGERKINNVSDDLYIIKDFFKYLYQNKRILHDVNKNIGIIKQKNYQYRELPNREETRQFFKIIDIYAKDPLKESLGFGFLFNNGLRIDELANIEWQDVNLTRNTISLTRKGNKSCIIYVPIVLQSGLKKLYNERGKQRYIFSETPKVFKRIITENYKVYAKLAGWNFPNGVHIFRHIFITYLTETKCTPGTLKELADVENFETLSYYIHRTDQELTEKINRIDFTF